ncbi:MAG: cytochrome b/b6 domain-containing protein [Proteobacteria bacterium]|nr:cytochrome b/b6 domain-containing protein [Pseudomonadota bacterium]
MNMASASPDNKSGQSAETRKILVWDIPIRVFHWLMAGCFAGAWLTAESESLRLLHVTLGYTMCGLVAFRIVWGILGTRYARFSTFVRGPKAVARYVGSMLRGQPEHHIGHNPAGALAIVALLGLTLVVTGSGWANYNDIAGKWLEKTHAAAANVMLAVVIVHILGVLVSSWLHAENLVGAMIKGRKPGRPEDGIRSAWRSVAVLMLAAVVGFWWLQWQDAPTGDGFGDFQTISMKFRDDDRDED